MSRQDEVQAVLTALPEDGQPCVGCRHSAACADLELACHAFRCWVGAARQAQGSANYEPSRRLFLLVMTGEKES